MSFNVCDVPLKLQSFAFDGSASRDVLGADNASSTDDPVWVSSILCPTQVLTMTPRGCMYESTSYPYEWLIEVTTS
jgi:hypothetical protein